MRELPLVFVVALAIGLPHALPLQRIPPTTAATVWLGALGLRAIVGIAISLFVLLYLPQTSLFHAIASWCLHAVLPLVTTHLSGHGFAGAATILPALALSASAVWVISTTAWAALAVRRRLHASSLGAGPHGSELIQERDIVVAATGLGRPCVVISDGAVAAFDAAELKASLAHERGHIERRHHLQLLMGHVLAALGCILPGTRSARRALGFALERDADEYAVRSTQDPLALASAICKAGSAERPATAMLASLGGERVIERVRCLIDREPRHSGTGLRAGARALTVLMITLTVSLVALVPLWASAGPSTLQDSRAAHHQETCH